MFKFDLGDRVIDEDGDEGIIIERQEHRHYGEIYRVLYDAGGKFWYTGRGLGRGRIKKIASVIVNV